jgi:hypothetical protein
VFFICPSFYFFFFVHLRSVLRRNGLLVSCGKETAPIFAPFSLFEITSGAMQACVLGIGLKEVARFTYLTFATLAMGVD